MDYLDIQRHSPLTVREFPSALGLIGIAAHERDDQAERDASWLFETYVFQASWDVDRS